MKYLLRHKKLYLVLDLDHTLLNSTTLLQMTAEEEYLKSQTDSLQGTVLLNFLCGPVFSAYFVSSDTFFPVFSYSRDFSHYYAVN